MANIKITKLIEKKYSHGFVTTIDQNTFPIGLDSKVIAKISERKNEPKFMLKWRLQAYYAWLKMKPPSWGNLKYPRIDYQKISSNFSIMNNVIKS